MNEASRAVVEAAQQWLLGAGIAEIVEFSFSVPEIKAEPSSLQPAAA
jgi:hypothetical protein